MKKLFQFVIVVITIGVFTNCTNAIIDDDEIPPIANDVKYDPDVKNILFNNCITCHSAPAPNAGLDLTTYSNVRNATENGNLLNRINNGANPMPPSGLMSAQNRATIQKWKDDGYLEN